MQHLFVARGPSHSLPWVDDMLDAWAGASWLRTLNFCHGHWQVELAQEDREKTVFTAGQGLYQFNAHCVHKCGSYVPAVNGAGIERATMVRHGVS